MRSHAGQPAFPGGSIDPGEGIVEAALRDGRGETGLDPASVLPVALLPGGRGDAYRSGRRDLRS